MTLQERLAMNQGQENGLSAILAASAAMPDGQSRVQFLSVHDLCAKANHTFEVRQETDYYRALRESIRENGIRVPLLVRRHPATPGRYEIIAGHTRWTAAREVGLDTVPCIVAELTDDEADIAMGETNIQRPGWLPSERARTFALWLEATRRRTGIQARQRTDMTAGTGFPQSGRNRDAAAEKWGISGKTFDMYLKLNDLCAPLLCMVDDTAGDEHYSGCRLPVKSAYQLAFLPEEAQRTIYRVLAQADGHVLRPNAAAALRQRLEKSGCCREEDVRQELGLLPAQPRPKNVTFSLPADTLPEEAKALGKDPAFQAALAAWVQSYLEGA